jgi:hypothetical protein
MNPITTKNILTEIEARARREILAKNPLPLNKHEEDKLQEAAIVSKTIGRAYDEELKGRKERPNVEQATHELAAVYRDHFNTWSKEDVVFLCSWIHACLASDALWASEKITK